jgi:hypothetical protein
VQHAEAATTDRAARPAALARLETRILFEALLDRYSRVELVAPIRRNPSHLIAGVLEATFAFG